MGPTFWKLDYKNCPLDAVEKVLHEELASLCSARSLRSLSIRAKGAAEHAAQMAELAASAANRHDSQSSEVKTLCTEELRAPLLELNVGGEVIAVSRETLSLAPEGSLLRNLLKPDAKFDFDSHRRIFLDLPPLSFGRIINHLRLRRVASASRQILMPAFPPHEEKELQYLAEVLGVSALLEERC